MKSRLAFPDQCMWLNEENPVECYNSIWFKFGCLAGGTKYPDKLTPDEIARYYGMNLRLVLSFAFVLLQESSEYALTSLLQLPARPTC